MTSTRDDTLRGVLATAATKFADEPGRAAITFRAAGSGGEGVRTHLRVGRHAMLVDEPPSFGGAGEAPNPLETALAALLSCQVVTYRLWAARLDVPLDEITIVAEGDCDVRGFYGLDDGVRPGFGAVRVTVTLTGPAAPERYQELAATVDAHCPVLDVFRTATPVTTTLRTG